MIKSVDHTMKYVIVGNSSVGKSALLSRFADNQFNPFFLSTIGVDFKFRNLDIDQLKCKVQIWDTAGQENFRAIISTYYNGADAIIVTYDMTSESSYEDMVGYWMGEAHAQKSQKTLLAVIGTKKDLVEKIVVNGERVGKLCEENGIELRFETSSKTAEGVDEAFRQVTRKVVERRARERERKGGEGKA